MNQMRTFLTWLLAPRSAWVMLSIVFAAYFINIQLNRKPQLSQRLFTAEELSLYNGTDERLPILLGILGSIFDVTKGISHYGVNKSYNHFAGRDASRAFVSGNFSEDGLVDSLKGLSVSEVKSVVDWRGFYNRTYTYMGKLVGLYYDSEGNATKALKGAEMKAAKAERLLKEQKDEESKVPNCNSRWSEGEGGEVWCDSGYPRRIEFASEIALTGKMQKRCACFKEDELSQDGLHVYDGCDFLATSCKV